MQPNESVVCDCCDLEVAERHASPITVAGLVRGWRCRKCNEHQGQHVKMAQDHEDEVRVRWGKTYDELVDTERRADRYKEQMHSAFRSRDNVLRQFERLSNFHHETLSGCYCGNEDCPQLAIIGADWISDLISRMNRR